MLESSRREVDIMDLALTLKRPLTALEAGPVRSRGRRGFGRGLVIALPIALLLWALIVWQF